MKIYTEIPQILLIPMEIESEKTYLSFSLEKPVANVISIKYGDTIKTRVICPCGLTKEEILRNIPHRLMENVQLEVNKRDGKRCFNHLHCEIALLLNLYHTRTGRLINTSSLPLPPEYLIAAQHLHFGGIQHHITLKEKPVLMHYFMPIDSLKIIVLSIDKQVQEEYPLKTNISTLYQLFKGLTLAQRGNAEDALEALLKTSRKLAPFLKGIKEHDDIPIFPAGKPGHYIILTPISNMCSEKITENNNRIADFIHGIEGKKILTRVSRGGVLLLE